MSALSVAELQRDRLGLVAAGPPLTPKREWFEVPEPENPADGAWTVTADGQVYGYAALWESCHTGKPGRCVRPPRSQSQYAYYMTGLTELEDGELIPTGRITLGTGHASLTASPAATAEHYDNTGAVAADVRIVDGKHGIWVSGALRPDVTPERARELRGASLSGDWRNIRGKLEMLGLLAVNVPGFPVPRTMVASGEAYEGHEEVLALVAAGVWEGTVLEPDITDEEWESALAELQDVLVDTVPPVDPITAAMELPVVAASRPFDASKHPRHPKGKREGGRFKGLSDAALADKIEELKEHPFSTAHQELLQEAKNEAHSRVNAPIDRTEDGTPMREPAEERWLREEDDHEAFEEVDERETALAEEDAAQADIDEMERELNEFGRTPTEQAEHSLAVASDEVKAAHASQDAGRIAVAENALKSAMKIADKHGVKQGKLHPVRASGAPTPVRYALQGDSDEDGVDEGRRAKIAKVMNEFKAGKLKSSSGKKVTNRKQALAIAMSESEHLAAAALTASLRERLVTEGYATEDGRVVVRGRFDLPGAITAAGEDEAARRFVAEAAEEMGVVEDLPATWDVDVLLARGTYTEAKHKRHPKGVREGGRFAPKAGGSSSTASEDDPSKGGKLVKGPGGKWMTRTEASMRADQAEGRQVTPSLVNFEELPDEGDANPYGMYTSEGGQAVEDSISEWIEEGGPGDTIDDSVEWVQKRVEQKGHGEVYDTAVRERLYEEIGPYLEGDSIASESKLIEGPGGRMMTRTEATELLDKERAGTPEQKADRAAKRAREEGRTEEARQYDRISHGEPATENERLAAISVEREALDTAIQKGDRDGVRRAGERLSELMKAPVAPETATQMLIPEPSEASESRAVASQAARMRARAANAPVRTSTSTQIAELYTAKGARAKELRSALAKKGIEGATLDELLDLEKQKRA